MPTSSTRLVTMVAALAVLACRAPVQRPSELPPPRGTIDPDRLRPVRAYVAQAWDQLTRSPRDLPEAAVDVKGVRPASGGWPVYVAAGEDRFAVAATLAHTLGPRSALVDLRPLPLERPWTVEPPGLLYLPEPYVVPGGRFNEMYGWDSHFIALGLLRDGRPALARAMVDNFLYQVAHYGKVLNANRTYYLSRSQPPLLSQMVRALYLATRDRALLARARPALEATHGFWTTEPHLAGDTGLSRYFDVGEGPAPEVVRAERDAEGKTHYERVRAFFRSEDVTDYDERAFYDPAADALTPLFYQGDRAMRESGFDPTNRWGPFGADVIHFAPVCLNSLLAVLEADLAFVATELGDEAAARGWSAALERRRRAIDAYLWDAEHGLYLDWNVPRRARRVYPFATTFWPLWAGLASREQAARVRAKLPLFERPGGLRTSDRVTGNQWDAPFGWAPLELLAALGLRRYGFEDDARRVADAFVSMLVEDFERRRVLVEKYDVERRTSATVEGALRFGYEENVVGFGWTNGVFLELLATFHPDAFAASAPR